MTTQGAEQVNGSLKRRGILAAAGAVVAGIIARQTSEPVAADGTQGTAMLLGLLNTETAGTNVKWAGATGFTGVMLLGNDTGFVDAGAFFPAAAGGWAGGGAAGVKEGVYGYSQAAGAPAGANPTSNGVVGYAAGGGNGVYGFAAAAGSAQINAGLFGDSNTTYGIIGRTTAPGYSSLTAITGTSGVAALAATSTNPSAYAAYFQGTTVVQGNFAVVGGSKSAAVKDASGQHRLVYCVESPESWFEDFGEASLVDGKADIALDKTFAEITHTGAYHVFVTSYGNYHLHVEKRAASGFSVRVTSEAADAATNAGGVAGTFSWRVVAKRKDIKGERLAKFDVPKIKTPDESKLPKQPDAAHP